MAMSETKVGTVTHYFQKIDVAVVEASAPIEVGDTLHVDGANDDFTFEVTSMEVDEEPVEAIDAGESAGVKVPERAHEGSDVLRVD
jgi:ribosomal 50S subunit-recycling heat shock protein